MTKKFADREQKRMFPDQTQRENRKKRKATIFQSVLLVECRCLTFNSNNDDWMANIWTSRRWERARQRCHALLYYVCSAEWCFCCWLMNLLKPVAWQWKNSKNAISPVLVLHIFSDLAFYFSWWWWLCAIFAKLLHSACGSTPLHALETCTHRRHTYACTQSYFSNCSALSHRIVCINMAILSQRFTN